MLGAEVVRLERLVPLTLPFMSFPAAIRKVIYTTNAIESLNATLCKSLNPHGHFPNDEAAMKVLYLSM